MLSKIHSYRLLFRRFCPLGSALTKVTCSSILSLPSTQLERLSRNICCKEKNIW